MTYEEGKAFADKEGLKFFEINTMDYKKVEVAFQALAENIIKKI